MQVGEPGMNAIFKLFGEIAIRNEAANKAITETTKHAEKAKSKMERAFEGIGKAAYNCGTMVAKGMAVGVAALGTLFKASVGEYADYEQLVGGVETLFKESKGKVMAYANNAYKTAGLSANDYMSTVTSFSASLLQGLGGDTEKAADIANMAITDMSDNANKMGTSMSSIQDAYQGFAKQNYTMLDNLKLGYGGTQAEMARLINDSGVLGDAITVTAETVNQVPFHKIIEAIHIVQNEMDITGTTAEEASTTISGSFASFKATWKNLLAGLTDEDADMSVLFGNMTAAGEILLNNLLALLPAFKENVATVMAEAGQYIHDHVRDTLWPKVEEAIDVSWLVENIGTPVEKFRTDVIEPIAGYWNETVAPAIKNAIVAVDDFLGLGLVDGWDSITNAAKIAWDNVKSSVVATTEAIEAYLGLQGNIGIGGGDLRPHYVRENPDLYPNQEVDGVGASGIWRIPFDGYRAILHKDETVLNRLDAREWRSANARGGLSADTGKLESMMGNMVSLMQQMVASSNNGQTIVLDSGVLVGQIASKMDAQLGTISSRKGRGN